MSLSIEMASSSSGDRLGQQTVMRLRVTYSKSGHFAYTSHLDLLRAWVRTLRRAAAPMAYTGGFNPRPRLQFASALPLGHTGDAEIMDAWLEKPVLVGSLLVALRQVVPEGLGVSGAVEVPTQEAPLQNRVLAADYLVTATWSGPAEVLAERIEDLLAALELPRERRGRRYDLRPLVERLYLEGSVDGCVSLGMRLASRSGATARPEAVLESLGMTDCLARYHRRGLLLAEV